MLQYLVHKPCRDSSEIFVEITILQNRGCYTVILVKFVNLYARDRENTSFVCAHRTYSSHSFLSVSKRTRFTVSTEILHCFELTLLLSSSIDALINRQPSISFIEIDFLARALENMLLAIVIQGSRYSVALHHTPVRVRHSQKR